jgi:hypothetical protein
MYLSGFRLYLVVKHLVRERRLWKSIDPWDLGSEVSTHQVANQLEQGSSSAGISLPAMGSDSVQQRSSGDGAYTLPQRVKKIIDCYALHCPNSAA